jgi:membrane AbrB-like protein
LPAGIPERVLRRPALAGLLVCTLAGALFARLGAPLPWLIGPLLTMALCRFGGLPLGAPRGAGPVAQLGIGTALGLYFTPPVAHAVAEHWALFVAAALFSLVVAHGGGLVLSRLAGTDRLTAFLASVPGGAQEMDNLADRYGGQVDRIALAQSLRILLVVVIVPFAFALSGVHGDEIYAAVRAPVRWPALGALFACTACGGLVLQGLRVPNAWMLGPLFVSIALTANGVAWSSMPVPLTDAAQVLIACNLGRRYDRRFVRAAPRYVLVVCLCVLLAMGLSAVFGALLAWGAGFSLPSLVLASAPGGVAEMSLTARMLQLAVPIVTAAHVSRVVLLVTSTGPMLWLWRRWRQRRAAGG